MDQQKITPEVMTLEEVAEYLRLSKDVVEQNALEGYLPGRRINNTWRFLKVAIDDWLRHSSSSSLAKESPVIYTTNVPPSSTGDSAWDIIGLFDSGIEDLAEKHDDYLIKFLEEDSNL